MTGIRSPFFSPFLLSSPPFYRLKPLHTGHSTNTSIVVGGVVGGLLVLGVIAVLIVLLLIIVVKTVLNKRGL